MIEFNIYFCIKQGKIVSIGIICTIISKGVFTQSYQIVS